MQRLHAGDYTEFPESGDILCARGFNVFNPVPRICSAVCFSGSLVGIKRQANSGIADRMSRDCKTEAVKFNHSFLVYFRVKIEEPSVCGIMLVRLQHRSSMTVSRHAIQKHLYTVRAYSIPGI